MKSMLAILLVLPCLGLDSCRTFASPTSAPETTVTTEIFTPLPADQRASGAARARPAQELNLDPLVIVLVYVTPLDWPDACLGLPTYGETYTQVATPGFFVRLQEDDSIYEF